LLADLQTGQSRARTARQEIPAHHDVYNAIDARDAGEIERGITALAPSSNAGRL
jgi:hypothetical protein